METQQIQINREEAEIFNGESICKQKFLDLLDEINLPKGLLPLDNLTEVGYNRTTGFVWLKQKAKTQHKFQAIGKNVSYDTEVTAFVEKKRMRRLTGVKSKEILIWATISDIYIDDKDPTKITFGNPTGISRSLPVSAFQLQEK
ncbi:uncharacterized protein [Euphorbia lathyris]|uniref:uncharacterized protein n=1 Tax=Euphorbia lathyris TaxID=212925 RepID=UPI003313F275